MDNSVHKILVVDSETVIVDGIIEFLKERRYSCVGCTSPREALALFAESREIDIVISAFKMPKMTGLQLIEAMHTAVGQDRIFESILYTGNAKPEDVVAALRAGVADYYQTPLDLGQLLNGLDRVIAKVEQRKKESELRSLSDNLNHLYGSLHEIYGGSTDPNSLGEEGKARRLVDFSKLSPRQRDVATLIAKGLTNYQIACDLGISENTVKIHVSQILRTFDLDNRTQLALALNEKEEVEPEAFTKGQA